MYYYFVSGNDENNLQGIELSDNIFKNTLTKPAGNYFFPLLSYLFFVCDTTLKETKSLFSL